MLAQSVMPAPVLAASSRPACPVDLGVLTVEITPELVDEVIELSCCREKRRRLLPAGAVVYFVLGLCLFSGADSCAPPGYRSVMRWLTNGLRHLHGAGAAHQFALTRARQRLGSKPLDCCSTCGGGRWPRGDAGAFAFGLRLVAWDGTGIDAADTPQNPRESGVTQGGNPQVRLLALTECGTYAILDAAFDGVTRASDHKLARRLLHALGPGMLLLADRNFASHELWGLVTAAGADMVWRIKKNLVLPPAKILPGGSLGRGDHHCLAALRCPSASPLTSLSPSLRPRKENLGARGTLAARLASWATVMPDRYNSCRKRAPAPLSASYQPR